LRNWYFVQASPNDERARKMQFDDQLMGELIRFVSSHEVGHTLGLRHNFGSSSAYPVEKLRDAKWVKEHGHAASIMDYARFNYVAQPGDGIRGSDLYPRINYYDKWAIEWGYKRLPDNLSSEKEASLLNQWILAKANDPKYWFGTESNPDDPRSQNEDLGDDAVLASTYGIKNLQYILPNLQKWTAEPNKNYQDLGVIYQEIIGQYGRYAGHVAKNIGGIYETPKTIEQAGPVYEIVPAEKQQKAMAFLNQEVFTTPTWLINYPIANLTGLSPIDLIGRVQSATIARLLSARTFSKLIQGEAKAGPAAYSVTAFLTDLRSGIWSDLATPNSMNIYTRNLQKQYIAALLSLITTNNRQGNTPPNPMAVDAEKTDVASVARGHLSELQTAIAQAIPAKSDLLTKYHLQDLSDRIEKALNP